MQAIVNIHSDNIARFEGRIKQVNNKANKLGIGGITVEPRGSRRTVTLVGSTLMEHEIYTFSISGEIPRINGFTLIGMLEQATTSEGESINMIYPFREVEIPVHYRNTGLSCDHCNIKRNRSKVFIIQSAEGELIQVGKTCLKDFVGDTDIHGLAWFSEVIADLLDDETFSNGGAGDKAYDIQDFVAHVAMTIKDGGWISASRAYDEGCLSTRDIAFKSMTENVKLDKSDRELAASALKWIRDMEDFSNSYLSNLHTACGYEYVTRKRLGIVASVIVAYQRAIEKAKTQAEVNNEFVGEIKERLKGLELEVINTFGIEGYYGHSTIIVMRDSLGHVFMWKKTGWGEVTVGDKVTLDGTIKDHQIYNDVKQTVLTRCKMTVLVP